MLWLAIYLPALALDALSLGDEHPWAVVERKGSQRQILLANASARARGVTPGLSVSAAQALQPDLRLAERNLAAEAAAVDAACCWAYALGSPVTASIDDRCIWVEVRRSLRLFGGYKPFRLQVEAHVSTLRYTHWLGVAPTRSAAQLLARAQAGLQQPVGRQAQIAAVLQSYSLALLPLEHSAVETLFGSGLRTIADVLAIPRDAIARRFGEAAVDSIEGVLGERQDVWRAYEPPQQYRRQVELPGAVEVIEGLLFPLRALIGDLALYLRARDAAIQSFELIFISGRRHEHRLRIGLMTPTRDRDRLLLVLREQLATVHLEEAVVELRIAADRFEEAKQPQADLFNGGWTSGDNLLALQERLAARLGAAALKGLGVTASHRPEGAWVARATTAAVEHPPRPAWLLSRPLEIAQPELISPPERLECGAWASEKIQRDYYIARDSAGRWTWVFRECGGQQWYLHGYWH